MTPIHGSQPRRDGSWDVAVWAPRADEVALVLDGPVTARHAARNHPDGWRHWHLEGVGHGQRYWVELDGQLRADPASRWQPEGVAGPSALVDPGQFTWTDLQWRGPVGMRGQVFYELHVGTFTPEGTFDAAAAHLGELAELGITVVELMPVAQFPGDRNWGYDGVLPSAAQDSYGGPEGLARFIDTAHSAGLAIVLDVVYNHLGPEGNHLAEFGPYFTATYSTPWGEALNFAEAGSDDVRSLFVGSARGWVRDFHVDGFRLDAVHAIVDPTATPFLEELTSAVHAEAERLGRTALVVAESSDNDPRLVRPTDRGGYGMDGVWQDEVHHAVRVAVTGETEGYYADFTGAGDLARALEHNVVFGGQYSRARGRRHGRPADDVQSFRYVVCDQNHDQIGNRAFGERLDVLVTAEPRRLANAVVALGPFTPMLFMGEEYGETAPFPFFVSHTDADLLDAVRRGRREEFAAFDWEEAPPDPAAVDTFRSAVLDRSRRDPDVEALWRALLAARRTHPVLHDPAAARATQLIETAVVHHRSSPEGDVVVVWNLGELDTEVPLPAGPWQVTFSTRPDPPRLSSPPSRKSPRISDPSGPRSTAIFRAGITVRSWEAVLLVRP